MGFFDRLKKRKDAQNKDSNYYNLEPDLKLHYTSGITADVNFGDVENLGPNFNNKLAQRVKVAYINPDNTFVGKSFLVEPLYTKDENGNSVWCTKEYYQNLCNDGNISVVKGFFKKEELDNIERTYGSNYIGGLSVDERGNFIRNYDESFKQAYGEHQRKIRAKESADLNHMKKREDEIFKQKLLEQVKNGHEGYQNMCDNEDSRNKAMQDLHRDLEIR